MISPPLLPAPELPAFYFCPVRILSYVKTLDGCSYHRIYLPNSLITENRVVSSLTDEDLAWCDILHYSRHTMISPDFLDQKRKQYGFKIVVDTDDWWEVGEDHPKYLMWSRGSLSLQVRQHMMYADAVTTTHDRLASLIPNDRVYVLPNTILYGEDQFAIRPRKAGDRVRLLYASTAINWPNTKIIAGAMRKIADLPVELVIAGYEKDNPLFDMLIENLTAGGKIPYKTKPWSDAKSYMKNYVGDIGILPSKDTKFNNLKSNLKVLEYAAMGIPVVVSRCHPYIDMPVNYFSGENQFVEQVTRLVEDKDYRKKCGKDLKEFCKKNYSMRDWTEKRISVYEQIIQRGNSNRR